MALVGYVRVSTAAQEGALQRDALAKAGCSKLFEDKASGAKSDRPGLNDALSYIRAGDVLVVWKLDRLGRSLSHLIDAVTALGGRGVGFKSLTEGVDTSTSNGRLVFHIFGSLAEFAILSANAPAPAWRRRWPVDAGEAVNPWSRRRNSPGRRR
jgi:DNA invertase Pin-like site-specific DNA recombinase